MPTERLDGFNGLLLTPNLDRAFDKGYVSFDGNGRILISPVMTEDLEAALGIRRDMALRFHDARIEQYLQYHRAEVFIHGD